MNQVWLVFTMFGDSGKHLEGVWLSSDRAHEEARELMEGPTWRRSPEHEGVRDTGETVEALWADGREWGECVFVERWEVKA